VEDPVASNLLIWGLGFLVGLLTYVLIFEGTPPEDDDL
jgi:hypothetical protein